MNLVYATPTEKIERDRLSHQAWGNPLTVSQYFEREQHLRAQTWAKQCMQTWLLKQGKKEGKDVLCSCETFQMQSALHLADGPRESGTVLGIASVFTEPTHRKKGFASALIHRLVLQLKATPSLHALVLFSDVGEPLYQRLGFKPYPAWDWIFKARSDLSFEPEHWKVPPLTEWTLPTAPHPHSPGLRIEPSLEQLQWHFAREAYYTEVLLQPTAEPPPLIHGATLNTSHILWSRDWKEDCLQILQLHAE